MLKKTFGFRFYLNGGDGTYTSLPNIRGFKPERNIKLMTYGHNIGVCIARQTAREQEDWLLEDHYQKNPN